MCSCDHPQRMDQDSSAGQVIRLQVDQVGGRGASYVIWIIGKGTWKEKDRVFSLITKKNIEIKPKSSKVQQQSKKRGGAGNIFH